MGYTSDNLGTVHTQSKQLTEDQLKILEQANTLGKKAVGAVALAAVQNAQLAQTLNFDQLSVEGQLTVVGTGLGGDGGTAVFAIPPPDGNGNNNTGDGTSGTVVVGSLEWTGDDHGQWTFDIDPEGSGVNLPPANNNNDCFVAGTKVTIVSELGHLEKNIEEIVEGDVVLSYNLARNAFEPSRVIATMSPLHSDIVEFIFDNGTSTKHTYDHPYYVIDKGWASYSPELTVLRYSHNARDLLDTKSMEIGDQVLLSNGEHSRLVDIKVVESEPVTTYNIHVDTNSNYFADGVLVHNKVIGEPAPVCVVAGTIIKTKRGDVPVEEIVTGDYVWTCNFETLGLDYFEVMWIKDPNPVDVTYQIFTKNGYGIRCSESHPIFVDINTGKCEKAGNLEKNSEIISLHQGELSKDVIVEIIKIEETVAVYNFEVDSSHSYISNNFLSHNMSMMEGKPETTPPVTDPPDDNEYVPPPDFPTVDKPPGEDSEGGSPDPSTTIGSGPNYNISTPRASFYSSDPYTRRGMAVSQPVIISSTELEPVFLTKSMSSESDDVDAGLRTPGYKFMLIQILSKIYTQSGVSSLMAMLRSDTKMMSTDMGTDSYVFLNWRRLLCNAINVQIETEKLIKGHTGLTWTVQHLARILNFSTLVNDRTILPNLTFKGHQSRSLIGGNFVPPDTASPEKMTLNGKGWYLTTDTGSDRDDEWWYFFLDDHYYDYDYVDDFEKLEEGTETHTDRLAEVYSRLIPTNYNELASLLGIAGCPATPTTSAIQLLEEVRRCILLGSAAGSYCSARVNHINPSLFDEGETSYFTELARRYSTGTPGGTSATASDTDELSPYRVWTDFRLIGEHGATTYGQLQGAYGALGPSTRAAYRRVRDYRGGKGCIYTAGLAAISHWEKTYETLDDTGFGSDDEADLVESFSRYTDWIYGLQDLEYIDAYSPSVGGYGRLRTGLEHAKALSFILNRDFIISNRTQVDTGRNTLGPFLRAFFQQIDLIDGGGFKFERDAMGGGMGGAGSDVDISGVFTDAASYTNELGVTGVSVPTIINKIIGENSGDITLNEPDRDSISYMFNTHTDPFMHGSKIGVEGDPVVATDYESGHGYSIRDGAEQRILLCEIAKLETGYGGEFIPGLDIYLRALGSNITTVASSMGGEIDASTALSWGSTIRTSTSDATPGPLDRLLRHLIVLDMKIRNLYAYISEMLAILSGSANDGLTMGASTGPHARESSPQWAIYSSAGLMFHSVCKSTAMAIAFGAAGNDDPVVLPGTSSSGYMTGIDDGVLDTATTPGRFTPLALTEKTDDGNFFKVFQAKNTPAAIQLGILQHIAREEDTNEKAKWLSLMDNFLTARREAANFVLNPTEYGSTTGEVSELELGLERNYDERRFTTGTGSGGNSGALRAALDSSYNSAIAITRQGTLEDYDVAYGKYKAFKESFATLYRAATALADKFLRTFGPTGYTAVGKTPWWVTPFSQREYLGEVAGIAAEVGVPRDIYGRIEQFRMIKSGYLGEFTDVANPYVYTDSTPLISETTARGIISEVDPWIGWLGETFLTLPVGERWSHTMPFDVLTYAFEEYLNVYSGYVDGPSLKVLDSGSPMYAPSPGAYKNVSAGINTGMGAISEVPLPNMRSFYRNAKPRSYRQALMYMIVNQFGYLSSFNIRTTHGPNVFGYTSADISAGLDAMYGDEGSDGWGYGIKAAEFGVIVTYDAKEPGELYIANAASLITNQNHQLHWTNRSDLHMPSNFDCIGEGSHDPGASSAGTAIPPNKVGGGGWRLMQRYVKAINTWKETYDDDGDWAYANLGELNYGLSDIHMSRVGNFYDSSAEGPRKTLQMYNDVRDALIREDTVLLTSIEVLFDYVRTLVQEFSLEIYTHYRTDSFSTPPELLSTNAGALLEYMVQVVLGVESTDESSRLLPKPRWDILDASDVAQEDQIREKVNFFLRSFSSPEAVFSKYVASRCVRLLSNSFNTASRGLPDPFDPPNGERAEQTSPLLAPVHSSLTTTAIQSLIKMLSTPAFTGLSGRSPDPFRPGDEIELQKKKIFTFGLPTGFMTELRNRAVTEALTTIENADFDTTVGVSEGSDSSLNEYRVNATDLAERFLTSNLIKITLHKKDLLDPYLIYEPLNFVFDTSAFYVPDLTFEEISTTEDSSASTIISESSLAIPALVGNPADGEYIDGTYAKSELQEKVGLKLKVQRSQDIDHLEGFSDDVTIDSYAADHYTIGDLIGASDDSSNRRGTLFKMDLAHPDATSGKQIFTFYPYDDATSLGRFLTTYQQSVHSTMYGESHGRSLTASETGVETASFGIKKDIGVLGGDSDGDIAHTLGSLCASNHVISDLLVLYLRLLPGMDPRPGTFSCWMPRVATLSTATDKPYTSAYLAAAGAEYGGSSPSEILKIDKPGQRVEYRGVRYSNRVAVAKKIVKDRMLEIIGSANPSITEKSLQKIGLEGLNTVILSPENYRDMIMTPSMFERVFCVLVDPEADFKQFRSEEPVSEDNAVLGAGGGSALTETAPYVGLVGTGDEITGSDGEIIGGLRALVGSSEGTVSSPMYNFFITIDLIPKDYGAVRGPDSFDDIEQTNPFGFTMDTGGMATAAMGPYVYDREES
tara:strand:+ start:777 stop:8576 length:7800 start_codon:yes stop_codon:yes gene_type:complete